jgi:hypothetical protein
MQNWSGIYDRTYYGDSGESRQTFHAGSQALMREEVKEMCRMGTMACNPEALAKRRQMFAVKQSYPRTDRGSFSQLFFVTQDQSWKPLGPKAEGGVKDFRYAQHLLKQREADFRNQEAQREGLPPVASETLELSPEESQSLELNNLLTQLDDSIEQGTFSSVESNELKNIARILIRLVPSFSSERLVDLIEYFEALVQSVKNLIDDGNKYAPLLSRFVGTYETTQDGTLKAAGMLGFLHNALKTVNLSPQQRQASARTGIDEYFKLFSPTERRTLISQIQARRELMKKIQEEKTVGPQELPSLKEPLLFDIGNIKEKKIYRENPDLFTVIPTMAELESAMVMQNKNKMKEKGVDFYDKLVRIYKAYGGTTPVKRPTDINKREVAREMLRRLQEAPAPGEEEEEEAEEAEEAEAAPEAAPEGSGKTMRFKIERLNRL